MAEPSYIRAPRWRTALAGLVDVAISGAALRLLQSRAPGRPARIAGALLAPTGELVREQLASPGQRLFAVRTVDRRTGRRTELWRTLVLVGFAGGVQLAERRLRPGVDAAGEGRRAELAARMKDISERYREEPARRDAEFRSAALQSGLPPIWPGLVRIAGGGLLAGAARRRLRRRLAPTVEVLARGRGDHSP